MTADIKRIAVINGEVESPVRDSPVRRRAAGLSFFAPGNYLNFSVN
jgi:hypothetical protein